MGPAQEDGSDEGPCFVELVGGLEGGGEGLAALQKEGRDAAAAQVCEGRLDAVDYEDLGPRTSQRRRVDFRSDDYEDGRLAHGLEQLRIERQACAAIEDDPNRLPGLRSGALYVVLSRKRRTGRRGGAGG